MYLYLSPMTCLLTYPTLLSCWLVCHTRPPLLLGRVDRHVHVSHPVTYLFPCSCVQNCGERLSVRYPLSLYVSCSNCDRQVALGYQWTVNTTLDWSSVSNTGTAAAGLNIKGDVLEPGQIYYFQIKGTDILLPNQRYRYTTSKAKVHNYILLPNKGTDIQIPNQRY